MYRPAGLATKATKRTKATKEARILAVKAGELASDTRNPAAEQARRPHEVTSVMSDAVSAILPRSVLRRSRSDSASAITGNDDSDSRTASSVMSDEPRRSSGSDGCSAWNTGSVTASGTSAPVPLSEKRTPRTLSLRPSTVGPRNTPTSMWVTKRDCPRRRSTTWAAAESTRITDTWTRRSGRAKRSGWSPRNIPCEFTRLLS
nr:unnamed protein product [Digitaria exilis]